MEIERVIGNFYADKNDKQLHSLIKFVYMNYLEFTPKELLNGEKCIIYNDSESGFPMLIIVGQTIAIRTSSKATSYWSQIIYQLGHEFCHYIFRQVKIDKSKHYSRYEEIISSAMSLYILQISYKNWYKCELFTMNIDYNNSIKQYLENIVDKFSNSNRANIACTLEEFYSINKEADSNREEHNWEVNQFYNDLEKDSSVFQYIIDYSEDYKDNFINIEQFVVKIPEEKKEKVLKILMKLQPTIR